MSDDDMFEESQLFVHYTFDFTMCRVADNMLLPSSIRVKADVQIIDEERVETALRKINYWFDEYVSRAIAVTADETLKIMLDENNAPRFHNPLMITPFEPTDSHLCMLFQSKMQALAAGAFSIGMVEITSDNAGGLTFTYIGDSEDDLPAMDQWITGGKTWFDIPWWRRDDASTFDTQAAPDSDLSVKPVWAIDLSFLERDEAIQDTIVLKGDFIPKSIDTPKDD